MKRLAFVSMVSFVFSYLAFIFLCVFGVLVYSFFMHDDAQQVRISMEGGLLEVLSAGLFAVAGVFALIRFVRLRTQLSGTFAALLLLASAREMDLHKAFTSDSMLKSRFYSSAETPFFEKIIGALVIALLLYCVWTLLRQIPDFIRRLMRFCPYAISVFLGLGVITTAKMLDSLARILPFAAGFKEQHSAYLGLIEESFEMAGAVIFFMLALALLKTMAEPADRGAIEN